MAGIPTKYAKSLVNLILDVGVILICIFIAPKLIMLFMPFIFGWLLALLAGPVVRFLEDRMKVKRRVGSALVMIGGSAGVCFAIYAIGAKLVKEAMELGNALPKMWYLAKIEFVSMKEKWSGVLDKIPAEVVRKAEELAGNVEEEMGALLGEISFPAVDAVGNFAQNIPGGFFAVMMSLLSAYFFVAEKDLVTNLIRKRLPAVWEEKLMLLKKTTVDVIAGYLKAQFRIEIWIYLIMVTGFIILKVPYGYLVAVVISLLDILPVLGTGIVLFPWALVKVFSGQYMFSLGLLLIWGIGQLVRQMIQPKMMKDTMGIAPIPTLILLYMGYKLAGVAGMVAAVPFGMFVVSMNKVGFFDNSKRSIKILWCGFQKFRQFTEKDTENVSCDFLGIKTKP